MTIQPNPFNQEIFRAVRFHPFFQGVEESTALCLLAECEHKHFEKSENIIGAHSPRTGLIFLLEGMVEVLIQEEVLEIVQKGELIGLSRLAEFLGVAKMQEAMVEVRAVAHVLALFIPFDVIAKRWEDPNVRDYLLAQVSIRLKDVYTSLAEQIKLSQAFFEKEAIISRVQDIMNERTVAVSADATIIEAAGKMTSEQVSSVLVLEDQQLVGILTEKDIVARVVAKGLSYTETCLAEVMTKNPVTIECTSYYYEALSSMLLNSIKHLPVLHDGKLVGVITLSDLLRKKNESYIKTIRSIEEVEESKLPQIKEAIYEIVETLLQDRVPALKFLETITALYDRLVVRIVDLAVGNLAVSGWQATSTFAFYQMGSGGRGEQFQLTDQDHFLVYEEGGSDEYFSLLGNEITRLLECAGYRRCTGLMMASEKQWRGSVLKWEERLRNWMLHSSNETLVMAQNFFAYRFIAGSPNVHQQFEKSLAGLLARSKIFLFRLTQVEREHVIPSLDHPFRILLRREKKTLDMKKEVLFPFHHSLQLLSLLHGVLSGTPVQRIEKLVDKSVLDAAFAEELIESLEQVLTLLVRVRWENKGKADLFFASLTTREKNALSSSLKAFRELQSIVFAHFAV